MAKSVSISRNIRHASDRSVPRIIVYGLSIYKHVGICWNFSSEVHFSAQKSSIKTYLNNAEVICICEKFVRSFQVDYIAFYQSLVSIAEASYGNKEPRDKPASRWFSPYKTPANQTSTEPIKGH